MSASKAAPSRERCTFLGSKKAQETVYFLLPVALLKVSEMVWPALERPSCAEPRRLPPSFCALSPPERVLSPSFWVVDFWPSGWTAEATLSPRPEAPSLAFWPVDFWESGVTEGG